MGQSMESRSFEPGGARMGEVTKVEPEKLSDRQLMEAAVRQGMEVHHCLEQHIAETRLAHLTASEARQKLEGKVDQLTNAVGALDTRQDITEGSVSALASALGGQVATGSVKVHAPMSWKEHAKIAATILGCLSGFVLLLQIIAPGIAATWEAIMKASP